MIPITEKHRKRHMVGESTLDSYEPVLEEYYKALMPTTKSWKVTALDDWCRKNINLEKHIGGSEWTFKDVVCASPDDLVNIKNLIDGLTEYEKQELVKVASYVVTGLYLGRFVKYGARKILEDELDVHVCPYCNRNLIYQIEKNGSFKTTCELDHFFSKGGKKGMLPSGYALLAVSFYNLIPTCQYCNWVKGEKELKAFYPHVFGKEEAEKVRFTFYPNKVDYFNETDSFDIGMKINIPRGANEDCGDGSGYKAWKRYDVIHDIDLLNILEVYQNNKRDVQRIMWKDAVFSEDYVSMLYERYKEHFNNRTELRNLVIDKPRDVEDVAETPLGKLKYDVACEIEEMKMETIK